MLNESGAIFRQFFFVFFLACSLLGHVGFHYLWGVLGLNMTEIPRLDPVQSGKTSVSLQRITPVQQQRKEREVKEEMQPVIEELAKVPPPMAAPRVFDAPKIQKAKHNLVPIKRSPVRENIAMAPLKKVELDRKEEVEEEVEKVEEPVEEPVLEKKKSEVNPLAGKAKVDIQAIPILESVASQKQTGALAKPAINYRPPPEYPSNLLARGIEGQVIIKALIDTEGRISKTEVFQSSGYPEMDQAALNGVKTWRGEPAKRGGVPVPFTVLAPVHFSIRDSY
ncbi:Hypothetical protein PBC10988_5000 [Planctomycetales bacterium 10988]|nr:Hypothetical protein PBC10988_5000 [Planctomycetales bacterium 10988]